MSPVPVIPLLHGAGRLHSGLVPPAAAQDSLSLGPYFQIGLNINEADPGNDRACLFTARPHSGRPQPWPLLPDEPQHQFDGFHFE